jgi:hypothetical protein
VVAHVRDRETEQAGRREGEEQRKINRRAPAGRVFEKNNPAEERSREKNHRRAFEREERGAEEPKRQRGSRKKS